MLCNLCELVSKLHSFDKITSHKLKIISKWSFSEKSFRIICLVRYHLIWYFGSNCNNIPKCDWSVQNTWPTCKFIYSESYESVVKENFVLTLAVKFVDPGWNGDTFKDQLNISSIDSPDLWPLDYHNHTPMHICKNTFKNIKKLQAFNQILMIRGTKCKILRINHWKLHTDWLLFWMQGRVRPSVSVVVTVLKYAYLALYPVCISCRNVL